MQFQCAANCKPAKVYDNNTLILRSSIILILTMLCVPVLCNVMCSSKIDIDVDPPPPSEPLSSHTQRTIAEFSGAARAYIRALNLSCCSVRTVRIESSNPIATQISGPSSPGPGPGLHTWKAVRYRRSLEVFMISVLPTEAIYRC